MITHQVCTTCKGDKPLSEFYGKSRYIKRKSCKACVSEQQKYYRDLAKNGGNRRFSTTGHKERTPGFEINKNVLENTVRRITHGRYGYNLRCYKYKLVGDRVCKFCSKCREFKPGPEFNVNMLRGDHLTVYCHVCQKALDKGIKERHKLKLESSEDIEIVDQEIDEERIAHNKVLDRIDREGYTEWYWNSLEEEIEQDIRNGILE